MDEDIVGFAESINGEFVAGCLLATVNDKKQYLHREGQFVGPGAAMYQQWEADKAIATARSRTLHKPRKDVVDEPTKE